MTSIGLFLLFSVATVVATLLASRARGEVARLLVESGALFIDEVVTQEKVNEVMTELVASNPAVATLTAHLERLDKVKMALGVGGVISGISGILSYY